MRRFRLTVTLYSRTKGRTSHEFPRTSAEGDSFEEPDRVPIDVGGSLVTGICIDAYVDLVKHLGLDLGLPIVYEQFGMLARLAEPVRQAAPLRRDRVGKPVGGVGTGEQGFQAVEDRAGQYGPHAGRLQPGRPMKRAISTFCDAQGKPLAYMPPGGLYFERACVTTMSDVGREDEPGSLGRIDSALQRRASPATGGIGQTALREHGVFDPRRLSQGRIGVERDLRRPHHHRLALPIGDRARLRVFHLAGDRRAGGRESHDLSAGGRESTSTRSSCPAPISERRRANSSTRGSSRNSTSPISG